MNDEKAKSNMILFRINHYRTSVSAIKIEDPSDAFALIIEFGLTSGSLGSNTREESLSSN